LFFSLAPRSAFCWFYFSFLGQKNGLTFLFFLSPVVSNFNEESTYLVLRSGYEWEASYYAIISFLIVWEVIIASSLGSRTRDEDPSSLGVVQDLVASLQDQTNSSFCFDLLLFVLFLLSSVPPSSSQKSSVLDQKRKTIFT